MATIYGDTEGMLEERSKGQTLTGIEGAINFIYGDAYLIKNNRGGNDVLTGGALSWINLMYGDADTLSDSRGGNDVLIGGDFSTSNFLYGDAYAMSDSRGGNDVINGGSNAYRNFLYGDSAFMFDSQGGNDVLIGGANTGLNINLLFGDGRNIFNSHGGNDVLTGGSHSDSNILHGDALSMFDSQGGNDLLTGDTNSHFNELYGDALYISAGRGGNDILIAHANPSSGDFTTNNQLYGDAKIHEAGNVLCGNDRMVSGTGNDDMWGDIAYSGYNSGPVDLTRVTTGQDVFIFSTNNGNDTIHDFRQGEDKIELQGIGVDSFDALMAASHLSQNSMNSVITFGDNTITVIGVTELTAADFLFT
jgi:hypothetical protein